MPTQPRYPRTTRVLDDSAKERVKDAIDLREYAGQYVELRAFRDSASGRCPFHDERTASFVVHERYWHCFGACGTGGDVFSFDMAVNKYSFSASLEHLSEYAGIPVDTSSRLDSKVLARRREHARREAAGAYEFWDRMKALVETGKRQAYNLLVAFEDHGYIADLERLARLDYLLWHSSPRALKESYEMVKNLPPETVLLAWTRQRG